MNLNGWRLRYRYYTLESDPGTSKSEFKVTAHDDCDTIFFWPTPFLEGCQRMIQCRPQSFWGAILGLAQASAVIRVGCMNWEDNDEYVRVHAVGERF